MSTAPTIRIIIPYFGSMPDLWPLTKMTMSSNPEISWVLFTDNPTIRSEANLTVVQMTLSELEARAADTIGVPVNLAESYKVCDLRPAFGHIFEDELTGYDWWGHADLDVVFGQLTDLIPADAFKTDKILFRGNFSLYKNNDTNKLLYRRPAPDVVDFRTVFSSPQPFHWDEWQGMHKLVKHYHVDYWDADIIFDMDFKKYKLRANNCVGANPAYYWSAGRCIELTDEGRREGLLIHLQKRPYGVDRAIELTLDSTVVFSPDCAYSATSAVPGRTSSALAVLRFHRGRLARRWKRVRRRFVSRGQQP